jgi:cell division protein FtsL
MITARNAAGVYSWQQKTKRKINTGEKNIKGFINSTVLIVALLFVCGSVYLYSINSSAVKGYQVRQVEKEILDLKKQNEDLKIKEAELKSLYHVEESSKSMNMENLKNISYIEEAGPVAMK